MKQRAFHISRICFPDRSADRAERGFVCPKGKIPDTELTANRSTYNTGATGTRAFYDLLAETGYKVSRWQQPPSALLKYEKDAPATFVIIGQLPREIDNAEATDLMNWVKNGGRLIVIDRVPPADLLATTANWQIAAVPENDPQIYQTDSANQTQMTAETVCRQAASADRLSRKKSMPSSRRVLLRQLIWNYVPYEEDETRKERPKGDFKINQSQPPPDSAPARGSVQGSGIGSGSGAHFVKSEADAARRRTVEERWKFGRAAISRAGRSSDQQQRKIVLVDFPFRQRCKSFI